MGSNTRSAGRRWSRWDRASWSAKTVLTAPPPPRTSFSSAEVDQAVAQLLEAARFATTSGSSQERYVPGLSMAVVFREKVPYSPHRGKEASKLAAIDLKNEEEAR
jgi:hypothetical protein